MKQITEIQKQICDQFGAKYFECPESLKLGIAKNVKDGLQPINGLRHLPENGTTGWYIWAGEELSDSPDFFQPLHVHHINEWDNKIKKYLGLAPGWRFLIAGEYVDVWFDEGLLQDSNLD